MAAKQFVALRALNRSAKVRVKNSDGDFVTLKPTQDVVVDLNDPINRRQLGRHGAIGQYIVVATNSTIDKDGDGASDDALPANT